MSSEIRLSRRSTLAMIPAVGAASVLPNISVAKQINELNALANRFFAANAAWLATAPGDDDLSCDCAEHDEAYAASKALLQYQCRTNEEVQRKIAIVKSCQWLEELAEVGFYEDHFWFRAYMGTLTI